MICFEKTASKKRSTYSAWDDAMPASQERPLLPT